VEDDMKITIMGVVPPCPRCRRLHELTVAAVSELGIQADIHKIAFDSDTAKGYGRVGTAHHIAEWANLAIDWENVWSMANGGWSPELDEALMPCKDKADAEGWLMTPVLLINDTVVFSGYVPDKKQIKEHLYKHSVQEVKER